jgi:hypothetical protein
LVVKKFLGHIERAGDGFRDIVETICDEDQARGAAARGAAVAVEKAAAGPPPIVPRVSPRYPSNKEPASANTRKVPRRVVSRNQGEANR